MSRGSISKLGLIYKDRLDGSSQSRWPAFRKPAMTTVGPGDYAERMAAYELTLVNDQAVNR